MRTEGGHRQRSWGSPQGSDELGEPASACSPSVSSGSWRGGSRCRWSLGPKESWDLHPGAVGPPRELHAGVTGCAGAGNAHRFGAEQSGKLSSQVNTATWEAGGTSTCLQKAGALMVPSPRQT